MSSTLLRQRIEEVVSGQQNAASPEDARRALADGLSSAINEALDSAIASTPVTKGSLGLGAVDDTADLDKPVSTDTIAALASKEDKIYPVPGGSGFYWNGLKQFVPFPSLTIGYDTFVAGGTVNGNRLLMLASDGRVLHFDPTDENNYERVIGFSVNSAVANGSVSVAPSGKLLGFGGLTAGAAYFASSDGLITSSVPSTGVFVCVGIAVTSGQLNIKVSKPIILI